ncbi:MAG: TonB-dependent receptor, partial [Bacteroidota bacterium]
YDDPNVGIIRNDFTDTDIAFSPNVVGGISLNWRPIKAVDVQLFNKYVGRQFLDNTSNEDRTLDAFFVTDFRASYSLFPSWAKEIRIGFQVNNLLSASYEPNGYTFSYKAGGSIITENFYYPMAPANAMANLVIRL